MFGITARDLSPDELTTLERREAAALAAREAEAAEEKARQELVQSIQLARQAIEDVADATRRGGIVLDQARQEGKQVLRFLGDSRRNEKRERIDATITDIEKKRERARERLEAAEALKTAANSADTTVAADLERGRALLGAADVLAGELSAWREEMEQAL